MRPHAGAPTPGEACWFFLRREPYYHKLQYSKTPKSDPAAALFGAGVGAFVGYLALSSLGSGGSDLTDLVTLLWYSAVWGVNLRLFFWGLRQPPRGAATRCSWVQLMLEVAPGVGAALGAGLTAGYARLRGGWVRLRACRRPR